MDQVCIDLNETATYALAPFVTFLYPAIQAAIHRGNLRSFCAELAGVIDTLRDDTASHFSDGWMLL